MISGLAEVSSIREKRALHARKLSLALCAMRLRPPPSPVSLYSETQRAPPWTPESARDATDLSHTHIVRRPTDDLQTTGSRESAGGPQDPPPRTSGPMRDGSDVPVGAVAPLRGARRAGAASRPRSPQPRSARGSPSPVRNRGGASRRSRVITVRAPAATRNPQRASRLRTTMGRQRAGAH